MFVGPAGIRHGAKGALHDWEEEAVRVARLESGRAGPGGVQVGSLAFENGRANVCNFNFTECHYIARNGNSLGPSASCTRTNPAP